MKEALVKYHEAFSPARFVKDQYRKPEDRSGAKPEKAA
jgi:hypothetical protein